MDNIDLYDELGEIFNAISYYTDSCIEIHNNFNDAWIYADFKLKIQQIQEKKLQENKILKFINFNFPHTFAVENLIDIKLEFEKCKFNHIDNRLTQNNKYYFKDCEINSIYFQDAINSTIVFEKCIFRQIKIINCYIMHRISFKNSIIENDFYLTHSEINKKADFSNVEFKGKSYFNRTNFLDYADFHEAIFSDIVSFYDVKFEKLMNFSSSIFRDFDKVNFVNTDIEKISIEKIEGIVDKKHKNPTYKREKNCLEEIKNQITDKEYNLKLKQISFDSKIRWINNFRNSFRIVKHILLEINNTLEAQKFHKLELYAKEIELEYQIEKENPNFATQENKKVEYKKENHKFNIKNWFILFVLAVTIAFLLYHEIILEAIVIPVVVLISIAIFIFICFLLSHFAHYLWLAIKFIFKFIFEFINSKTPINYIIYIIQTFYNSINRYINKEYFKTLLDYTKYIDYWRIRIYRNTSEHHTNFTRILNFTIVMISLYGLFIFLINKTVAQNSTEFMAINMVFAILIILVFVYFIYVLPLSAAENMGLFLILILVCVTNIFSILSFYGEITFFAVLYLLSVLLLYRLFIAKNNLITFTIRAVAYIGFLFMIYISPSMILPFANLNSQEFKTEYLENNISEANKTEIIELASIINPEFNATKNPNSSENLSISELNEYKKFIVENKDDLYKKLDDNDKFKQAIYADNSRNKTIKCISFIYAIILGLCLFSLQKTARRNSVVPS